MNALNEIIENRAINSWVRCFTRDAHQLNRPHESDAEIIPIPGDPTRCLAVTIDTVAEEITTGLYRDPHTMGWVTIMASLSDLAAVGATPLGLVISVCVEPGRSAEFTRGIAQGMEDACRALGVFILGAALGATLIAVLRRYPWKSCVNLKTPSIVKWWKAMA
jgi:thiamine monophosphate kinase